MDVLGPHGRPGQQSTQRDVHSVREGDAGQMPQLGRVILTDVLHCLPGSLAMPCMVFLPSSASLLSSLLVLPGVPPQ